MKSVLVVDDEILVLKLINSMLIDRYKIFLAGSVKEALTILDNEENLVDLIISDVKMPGEDGISVLKRFRENFPHIPVILISAHADKDIAIEAVHSGAYDFLEKPFREDELIASIERTLKNLELQSELFTIQQRMKDSEKMAEMGLMAGSIAHEIVNPISIITAQMTKLKKLADKSEGEFPELQKIADKSLEMVTKVSRIIKSLRNLSRTSGEVDDFEPVKVLEVINDATVLCQDRFKARGLAFKEVIEIPGNLILSCSHVGISQVLVNLLNNAEQAIKNNPEKWVSLEASLKDDFLIIKIIDSGNGIPMKVQEKMFETFFTTKPIGEGTGLGLSTCVRIIEAHRGTIKIDNDAPNTTFVISIPLKQAAEKFA